MLTEKLYYQDPYLKAFSARILTKTAQADGKFAVVLDRTAFYPEGGGQPCDTGSVNGQPVLEVLTRDGEIVHVLAGDPGEGEVTGEIDWQRRFGHMQQHTGEHLLSGVLLSLYQAENVGFHLGADASHIDATLPALSTEQVSRLESAVNGVIFADLPVDARFIDSAELAALPLRKEPGREFDRIRLVSVQDCDCCPCGGTHVARTGEVGLLKILGWEKRKGNIRIDFVCGHRALADYQRKHEIARFFSTRFSTPVEQVLPAFERAAEKQELLARDLAAVRKMYHEELAGRLLAGHVPPGPVLLVSQVFPGYGPADLLDFAGRIVTTADTVCLLGAPDAAAGRSSFLFAAAPGVPAAMHEALRHILSLFGGKGGGNAVQAQGGAPTPDAEAVLSRAREYFRSLPGLSVKD